MPFVIHLMELKRTEAAIFDILSLSDWSVAAAYNVIQEAGGPILMHDYEF